MTKLPHVALPLLLACILPGGCSPPNDRTALEDAAGQQTFSAEDQRIARSLSLGNEAAVQGVANVDRSMACSVALDTLRERLFKETSLAPEVIQAFNQAQQIYADRASAGLTSQDVAEARAAAEDAIPDEGDRARLAIGCLRDLA